MARLESVTVEEIRGALAEVEKKRPAKRLFAAIAHKNGVAQRELAEWFDVERKTVYNWLTRLESDEGLAEAARDDDHTGRPRRLSDEQLSMLDDVIDDPPNASGFDASEWTPALLRRFVAERWGVEYSTGSCRRLLRELD